MARRRPKEAEGPWISILMALLLALGVLLMYRKYTGRKPKESFVSSRSDRAIVLRGGEAYDDFYAKLYPGIMGDKMRIRHELATLLGPGCSQVSSWADIGCGIGWHTGSLAAAGKSCIGVDRSVDMLRHAQRNYPSSTFLQLDVDEEDSLLKLPPLDGMFCLNFTLYLLQSPRAFVARAFKRLPPNGVLVLHAVDPDQFDATLEASVGGERAERSIIEFSEFTYKSRFVKEAGEEAAAYVESIVPKADSVAERRLEHLLLMPDKQSIVDTALKAGFILVSDEEMKSCGYDNHYILVFKKPS